MPKSGLRRLRFLRTLRQSSNMDRNNFSQGCSSSERLIELQNTLRNEDDLILNKENNAAADELKKIFSSTATYKPGEGSTPHKSSSDDPALKSGSRPVDNSTENHSRDQADVSEATTLKKIVKDLFSDDENYQHSATVLTRMLLCKDIVDSTIDSVIQAGIIPRCVVFLTYDHNPNLQFEAAWVLTNVAAGNECQTKAVMDAGAVEPLIDLLQSSHEYNIEQAAWALGNIAGNDKELRDLVIRMGILPPLADFALSTESPNRLKTVAWTLYNLSKSDNEASLHETAAWCLPALARLIKLTDMQVVADACWALSSLTDRQPDMIDHVMDCGVVPRLVELLDCQDFDVVTPCLVTVGNIVADTDSLTQYLVASGVLPRLARLLRSTKSGIAEEVALTVSNIAAEKDEDLISDIIFHGIASALVDLLSSEKYGPRKEALWALTHITSSQSVDFFEFVQNSKVIPALSQLLSSTDHQTLCNVLICFENILQTADKFNQVDQVARDISKARGVSSIEQLQSSVNLEINLKAREITQNYFQ